MSRSDVLDHLHALCSAPVSLLFIQYNLFEHALQSVRHLAAGTLIWSGESQRRQTCTVEKTMWNKDCDVNVLK